MGPGELYFRVLGPVGADLDGEALRLGGARPRALLAMLLTNPGHVVSTTKMVDGLWEDDPPERPQTTVQVHMSNLRRALHPGTPAIVTQPPGYVLNLSCDQLDLLKFEDLSHKAADCVAHDQLARAEELYAEALSLWRGPALDDLGDLGWAQTVRASLEGRQVSVQEDRVRLLVRLGRYTESVHWCEESLADHPVREGLWEQLMVALYREGRPAEALEAYRRCREWLRSELGVDPTPRLQALEQAVLHHDPRLLRAGPDDRPGPGSLPHDAPHGVPQDGGDQLVAAETVQAPSKADGYLLLEDGTFVELAGRMVIGRNPDCDVRLIDPEVSRRHAEIRPHTDTHVLRDTSFNGTFIEDTQVTQRVLRDGDRIRMGQHTLTYLRHRPEPGR